MKKKHIIWASVCMLGLWTASVVSANVVPSAPKSKGGQKRLKSLQSLQPNTKPPK